MGTMPSKNVVKKYKKGGFYHIYNRGVEKREIFLDEQDIEVYRNYCKRSSEQHKVFVLRSALMRNHVHFIVVQNDERGIERFIRGLHTLYSLYFNYKYQRTGTLWQGRYRARLLKNEKELEVALLYVEKNLTEKDALGPSH